MNLPAALFAVRVLVIDTFRQALSGSVFWALTALNLVAIVFCLSVGVRGDVWPPLPPDATGQRLFVPEGDVEAEKAKTDKSVAPIRGEMTYLFGAFKVPLRRDRITAVRDLQQIMVSAGADTVGLLLALVFTAGFVPSFVDPGNAAVLLAKPVPRWALLAGKFLGVVLFLAVQAVLFVGGTWLALGLVTGVRDAQVLFSIPVLLVNFVTYFGFSTLLAVTTRSTVAAVFGSLLFWAVCWGINLGRNMAVGFPIEGLPASTLHLVDLCYWLMPKPMDMHYLLSDAIGASAEGRPFAYAEVTARGAFHPFWSVVSSLAFAAVLLALAAHEFVTADY
jgi:ABC-type transport system involved in multi-copper enzyme maturation permease subunit